MEDGVIKVSYDQYPRFNGEFGHLFYQHPVPELQAAGGVSIRGRPSARRTGLGVPQQRRR